MKTLLLFVFLIFAGCTNYIDLTTKHPFVVEKIEYFEGYIAYISTADGYHEKQYLIVDRPLGYEVGDTIRIPNQVPVIDTVETN